MFHSFVVVLFCSICSIYAYKANLRCSRWSRQSAHIPSQISRPQQTTQDFEGTFDGQPIRPILFVWYAILSPTPQVSRTVSP